MDLLNFGILVLDGKRSLNNRRLTTFKRCQTIHLLNLLFAQNLRMLIGQRHRTVLMLVIFVQMLVLMRFAVVVLVKIAHFRVMVLVILILGNWHLLLR